MGTPQTHFQMLVSDCTPQKPLVLRILRVRCASSELLQCVSNVHNRTRKSAKAKLHNFITRTCDLI